MSNNVIQMSICTNNDDVFLAKKSFATIDSVYSGLYNYRRVPLGGNGSDELVSSSNQILSIGTREGKDIGEQAMNQPIGLGFLMYWAVNHSNLLCKVF